MNHDNDTISILCPTRLRPGLLACTIRLLHHLATRPERIEVLLRVDDDDPTDYEQVWAKCSPDRTQRIKGRIIVGKRLGYSGLHECFTELAAAATGRWRFLWNDDVFMATPGWDDVLDKVKTPIAVAWTESNHGRSPCTFPAFTREYFEAVGHVALNCHNDTWLEEVSREAGVNVDVPITVLTTYADDTVAVEGKTRIAETSAAFYTPAMVAARAEDVRAVREGVRWASCRSR